MKKDIKINCCCIISVLAASAVCCFIAMQLYFVDKVNHQNAAVSSNSLSAYRSKIQNFKSLAEKNDYLDGYPLGYNPASFGASFSIVNNGKENAHVEVDIRNKAGQKVNEISTALNVGEINHYHQPYDENDATFTIWIDSTQVAIKLKKDQYYLCDRGAGTFFVGKGVSLLTPESIANNSALQPLNEQYCSTNPSLRGLPKK